VPVSGDSVRRNTGEESEDVGVEVIETSDEVEVIFANEEAALTDVRGRVGEGFSNRLETLDNLSTNGERVVTGKVMSCDIEHLVVKINTLVRSNFVTERKTGSVHKRISGLEEETEVVPSVGGNTSTIAERNKLNGVIVNASASLTLGVDEVTSGTRGRSGKTVGVVGDGSVSGISAVVAEGLGSLATVPWVTITIVPTSLALVGAKTRRGIALRVRGSGDLNVDVALGEAVKNVAVESVGIQETSNTSGSLGVIDGVIGSVTEVVVIVWDDTKSLVPEAISLCAGGGRIEVSTTIVVNAVGKGSLATVLVLTINVLAGADATLASEIGKLAGGDNRGVGPVRGTDSSRRLSCGKGS